MSRGNSATSRTGGWKRSLCTTAKRTPDGDESMSPTHAAELSSNKSMGHQRARARGALAPRRFRVNPHHEQRVKHHRDGMSRASKRHERDSITPRSSKREETTLWALGMIEGSRETPATNTWLGPEETERGERTRGGSATPVQPSKRTYVHVGDVAQRHDEAGKRPR